MPSAQIPGRSAAPHVRGESRTRARDLASNLDDRFARTLLDALRELVREPELFRWLTASDALTRPVTPGGR